MRAIPGMCTVTVTPWKSPVPRDDEDDANDANLPVEEAKKFLYTPTHGKARLNLSYRSCRCRFKSK